MSSAKSGSTVAFRCSSGRYSDVNTEAKWVLKKTANSVGFVAVGLEERFDWSKCA